MILIRGITKSYAVGGVRRLVLDEASLTIGPEQNVGLLGVNGAGKSTLLRMIAGTELPDSGTIMRHGSVSWPIGFTGSFSSTTSGRGNVRFIARIYGRDVDEVTSFVEDFSELGPYLDQPVKSYSSGMRARLAFAVSMAIDFQTYLVDEVTAVGDARFAQKCSDAFRERRGHSNVIMVSHSIDTIRDYCESAAIIAFGKIFAFDDIEDGLGAYKDIIRYS